MINIKYNLFHYAPKESSHSAFWAWILSCADAEEASLKSPRKLAKSFLKNAGVRSKKKSVQVQREYSLKEKSGRIDIFATIDEEEALVIETKILAIPDTDQLNRYREKLKKEYNKIYLVMISTAFEHNIEKRIKDSGWKYFDVNKLLSLFSIIDRDHQIVEHYRNWLMSLEKRRNSIAKKIFSSNHELRDEALRSAEGQWELLRIFTETFDGIQYRGYNADGSPWTQFRFVEGKKNKDHLFYRIDYSSKGPYLSLRQYQYEPKPSIEAKLRRLDVLRNIWNEVSNKYKNKIKFATQRNRGIKESEIGLILLDDNSIDTVRTILPQLHRRLLGRLRAEGWPLIQ